MVLRTNSEKAKSHQAQQKIHVFEQGFVLHQQGHLDLAEFIYQRILIEDPKHFDALHFLGILNFQRKRFENPLS